VVELALDGASSIMPPKKRQKGQPSLLSFLGSSNQTSSSDINEREIARKNQKDLDNEDYQDTGKEAVFIDSEAPLSAAEAAESFRRGLVWLQLQPECRQDWVSVLRELHNLAESLTTKEDLGTDREGGPE